MSVFWQIEVDDVLLPNELPASDLSESGIFSSDVKGSVLRIVVETFRTDHWIGPLDVIVYGW